MSSQDHKYILKRVDAQLMLDSLPKYKFMDGGVEKEKRTLVSGLIYTITLELIDDRTIESEVGLPDAGDMNLDTTTPAIGHSSWADQDTLNEWYLRTNAGYTDTVTEIKNKTYYYAVPTAPGPVIGGSPQPPENTEWLKLYTYPVIDVGTGFIGGGGTEGVDYVAVPDWDWKIAMAGSGEDADGLGKIRRQIFLKGKWRYQNKRGEFTVEL